MYVYHQDQGHGLRFLFVKQVKANEMALAVKLADIADNFSRLNQLTDLDTKKRLTEKYQKAMDLLGE